MWGDKTFLEHLAADIVVARNSSFTCTGANNAEGGRNIDYYILSNSLLGTVKDCYADFQVPFAPHFGIILEIAANPAKVMARSLIKPDLPKKILDYDKK